MKRKGAIFDLDGTILDSMGIWSQIDIDFLAKRGVEVPEDYQKMITPMGFVATAEYTIRRFGLDEKPEALIAEWQEMAYDAYANRLLLKPFAGEYVRQLALEGVDVSIASSSDPVLVNAALKHHGLLPYIKTVVTAKDVSRGKGFPDIYLKAAEGMRVEPENCRVFEDIPEGIRGAKTGGFFTVGVYEKSHRPEDIDLIRKEADRFIRSFEEMMTDTWR